MSVCFPTPKPYRALPNLGFCFAVVLLAARPTGTAAPSVATAPGTTPLVVAAASLDAEKREGEKLASKVASYLGPLAPVALSPFFALTCLSGASLLADYDIPFLSGVRSNPILGENSALNNPVVFAGLLALTLLTAAPKLTKVTKPLGQAIDQIEAHAGIISIVLVQYLSRINLDGEAPPAAAIVFQAGILSFSADVILSVIAAINIFVVNTVKFFFEVLIWLSPIPTVDAMFEAANKACAAFLVGVYVWSPAVATILNLLIFAVCLLIFAWARRRASYMHAVLGDPVLGWLAEKLFRRPPATVTSTSLPSRIAQQFPERALVLKAFVGEGVAGMKRKSRGFLLRAKDGRLVFAQPRMLRAPVIVPLAVSAGASTVVERGLLSTSIVLPAPGSEAPPVTLLITRRYNALLDEIGTLLGASAASTTAPAAAARAGETDQALAASRAIGAAAKADAGRTELREEFA